MIDDRYGAVALEADAQAHVDGCDACRGHAADVERLEQALARDADQEPGPGFDTRFFARLEEAKSKGQRGWLSRFRWSLAGGSLVAAAATTALLLTINVERTPAMAGDLELAMHLDLLEDYDVVSLLEDVETFEVLARVDLAVLEDVATGEKR
ncbi:MAG: hypothetical protein V3T05_06160 [Myxococcota bacterium]